MERVTLNQNKNSKNSKEVFLVVINSQTLEEGKYTKDEILKICCGFPEGEQTTRFVARFFPLEYEIERV